MTRRIYHHHIGGRGGDTGFNVPANFEADITRVLFDADPDSIDQAAAQSLSVGRTHVIVRPYFVGVAGRELDFYINLCPYTSSALKPDPRAAGYLEQVDGSDYVFGQASRPIATIRVKSQALDDLVADPSAGVPAPDLLSIDAQGGEREVLQGARGLLDRHVVALAVEVAFNPQYSGAPYFGDIAAMLREHGFLFSEFSDFGRFAPGRMQLGARGVGLTCFADAVFFKDPERLGQPDRGEKLTKLAFVALCRGQLEFAMKCLAERDGAERDGAERDGAAPADMAWHRFVNEFCSLATALPDIKPWLFAEAYNEEQSQARSRTSLGADVIERIRQDERRRGERELAKIEQLANSHVVPTQTPTPALERLLTWLGIRSEAPTQSPAERYISAVLAKAGTVEMAALFRRHGLADVAAMILQRQTEIATNYVHKVIRAAGST